MSSKASRHRATVKKEDPAKYAEILEKNRLRCLVYREAEKKKWEEEPHTRAQIEAHEKKRQAKREREAERYRQKKALQTRQTRNSQPESQLDFAKTPEKRRRDMNDEERRAHDAAVKKRQRDARSSQKKVADLMKRRRQHKMKREIEMQKALPQETVTRTPSRLPRTAYNLNYEFKSRSKELNLSHEQYAQTALNLVNPRTPEKRAAIARLQGQHPCRVLFQCHLDNIEEELGITIQDEGAEADLLESTNPTHDLIKDFYHQETVSRMLPHARYTTKHGAARVMTLTVKDAHTRFREANPDVSVGLTLFQQQRPRNVRLLGSVPMESCLCIYCTNVRLKLVALNGVLGKDGRLPSEAKLLNFINCPVDGKWNNVECIDGLCPGCSDRLRPIKVYCRDILHIPTISWKTWARNEDGKLEPITKDGSMKDLLEDLQKDLVAPSKGVSFSQHLFTAYWQYDQFKMNRRNPEDGEVVMVQDFAENRKAVYAEEIKSVHFGKGQITVHPMVCFYRNGEHIVRHAILLFSDDIGHDFHAVNAFTLKALGVVGQSKIVKKLTIWSDGAASQYKGKGTFADLSLLSGLEVQRCFYGSEHGKGEADGETGVLSQILKRAAAGGQSFRNASDMVGFLQKHHFINSELKKRDYLVLNEIDRDRPQTEVQTIPGTRKFHQFCRVGPYIIKARRLACFCTACCHGNGGSCLNKQYVGEYAIHKLKPSIQTTINEGFIEETQTPQKEQENISPRQTVEEYTCPQLKVGDFVEVTCDINKLTRKFYAVVIPSPEACADFFVRFFRKGPGNSHVFGDVVDEGTICQGPPDNYKWKIIPSARVRIDNRGHYFF